MIINNMVGGYPEPWLWPLSLYRTIDTNIVAGTDLTLTTIVGWVPYALPPRSQVTGGRLGGTVTPTSAGNAGFQVQLYTMSDMYLPTTRIGSVGAYNIVGAGGLLDTSTPPYVGFGVGLNWWADFTPPDGWRNESYSEPLLVSLGVQLQGAGAFTGGEFYTAVRNPLGPSFMKLASAQAWQYAFGDNPVFTSTPGQAAGNVAGRPLIQLLIGGI
jgi:hypothetical protein